MTETEKRKNYRVLLPAAGIGSRLSELTRYINKALINIGNKPVISRIIDMFPENTEFVIALGYKGDLIKQFLSLAYPEKTFYFCLVDKYEGTGSGLGLSISACEKYLHCPFVFCSADTLAAEKIPYPDKNIAGFGARDDISQYRTLRIKDNKVSGIYEKGIELDNLHPYIGLACIYDYELFWQIMQDKCEEKILQGESYALKKFAQKGILEAKEFTWFDTGNKEELEKTREYFKEADAPDILPKADEAIWFIADKAIKFSDNKDFIRGRIKRAEFLKGFIPEIINYSDNMYVYKKAEGFVLSKINDIDLFKNLLDYAKTFWTEKDLSQDEKADFINICNNFYKVKTLNRVRLYYSDFQDKDGETIINGVKTPPLEEIIQNSDWKYLCSGTAGRFHGDFHFENILYNKSENKFIFLDWRQNFGGLYEYGDIYYDLAKLLHGTIICHGLIAQNKYKIIIDDNKIDYDFERKEILIECEKFYYKWLDENGYDSRKVKILTSLIFLNIAALHHKPYSHLLYYLGKYMLYKCQEI